MPAGALPLVAAAPPAVAEAHWTSRRSCPWPRASWWRWLAAAHGLRAVAAAPLRSSAYACAPPGWPARLRGLRRLRRSHPKPPCCGGPAARAAERQSLQTPLAAGGRQAAGERTAAAAAARHAAVQGAAAAAALTARWAVASGRSSGRATLAAVRRRPECGCSRCTARRCCGGGYCNKAGQPGCGLSKLG